MSEQNLPMMHSTYFTLGMGSTPANRDSYMECCAAYLSESEGMESFWIAELAQDMFRVQNDRAFNVNMNQIFENQSKFDIYNKNDTSHSQFVVEVDRWSPNTGRRVFDSYLHHLEHYKDCQVPSCDEDPRMIHNVYFSLTDNSEEGLKAFMDICVKYLSDHPGMCTFALGTLADLKRDISMNNYDVAMNMLWQNKAAYSDYLDSSKHHEFFPASQGMISTTQVFDSYKREIP